MKVQFKLEYRKFPAEPSAPFPQRCSALRPAIPITLVNGDKKVRYFALIDSGADFCIFHAEIGEQIGLGIESGKKLQFFGIDGARQTAYFHHIEIEVGGHRFPCYAGFSMDLGSLPYGILGQVGFLTSSKCPLSMEKGLSSLN